MNLELNSKRVLVTGSSKGIGFSIANHFLEEGANVILVARELENLKSAENKLVKKYGENRCSQSDFFYFERRNGKEDSCFGN